MRSPISTVTALCAAVALAASAGAQQPASRPANWKHGGVCYEIFVRSFFDSDGDGIGDLNGLTQKLDYINDGNPATQRDLGARCIWLMPVAESPSYHGYDVTNYYRVERDYGTNDDFKRLVAEAHRRGIKVLVDMVLNHSSSEHPYFKEAMVYPASRYRDWYRWSPAPPADRGPWGQVVWHRSPVREESYFGLFVDYMPDLNYENPAVREEAKKIARYWLEEMGVDGFRLDAIRHIVEEGNVFSNTRGTHDVLREYAAFVRGIAPSAFTIGEVWDSTGAMLPYYPDQLDAHFAFEAADAIIEAVRTGSGARLLPPFVRLQTALPADRWSPFLRNHDQTRTATELGGDIGRARLAATLLLTLPGLPFIYYGEEIGMTGNKPDPRLRTPMHWSRGPAAGFSRGLPWEPLQPDSLTANVEAQDPDPRSLLNRYRQLVHLRADNVAIGSGELIPLTSSSDSVAAYLRRSGDRVVLVVANLARGPLSGVTIASADRQLAPGRYALKSLLSGPDAATLRIGSDGHIRGYAPLAALPPTEGHVFELTRQGR